MYDSLKLNGVVLIASPIHDYDRRVEILTSRIGRISAFVPGARRNNSPLSACSMPFTFAEYELFQGKNSYTVKSASIKKYFDALTYDYDKVCMASYFSEMIRFFTRENVEATQEVNLLFFAVNAIIKANIPLKLIRIIFEMRMMLLQGEAPELYKCLECGKPVNESIYIERGGMVCHECEKKNPLIIQKKPYILSQDALYVLQYILSSADQKLFAFNTTQEVIDELAAFMKEYFDVYVKHDFKSLELII